MIMSADAGKRRIGDQKLDGGGKEFLVQPHVAVDQTDKIARAVLIGELDAGTAGTVAGFRRVTILIG